MRYKLRKRRALEQNRTVESLPSASGNLSGAEMAGNMEKALRKIQSNVLGGS